MHQGAYAEADASLRQGLDRIAANGEVVWEAELHRINGLVRLAENELGAAQESLQQAIRIARGQSAKSLELRAATNLARMWGEQGRRAEARELLAAVYSWFTEGFDTASLKEAKALLDQLT
jgi:predicted ATPase